MARVAPLLLLGLACTCTRGREERAAPPPEARGGGPGVLAPNKVEARGVLSQARCQREERCGQIGEGRPFDDLAHCSMAMKLRDEQDGFLRRCGTRIDTRGLERCVAAVASLPCGKVNVSLGTLPECAATELCRSEM